MKPIRTYRLGRFEMLSSDLFDVQSDGALSYSWNSPRRPETAKGFSKELAKHDVDPKDWRVPLLKEMRLLADLYLLGVGDLQTSTHHWPSGYLTLTPFPNTHSVEYQSIDLLEKRGRRSWQEAKPLTVEYTRWKRIRPVRSIESTW